MIAVAQDQQTRYVTFQGLQVLVSSDVAEVRLLY